MTTLWDTTGRDVVSALSAERRRSGVVSTGLALTLCVVVEEKDVGAAEQAATRAAAEHPCRLLMVVRRRPDAAESRLDAELLIGGRLGPGEAVVMRMYGRLALHAESVVLPLLAPDAPVVTWWAGAPPDLVAHDPLGVFADRRVTDCSLAADPVAALRRRADDYAPGDTDLAWTRSTQWRALCASAFDPLDTRATAVRVIGPPDATRALLAGWLGRRLGVEVAEKDAAGDGVEAAEFDLADGTVLRIGRGDGRSAVLARTGQPDRSMPLPPREVGDLLAEELRRLDPDDTYAEALEQATGTSGLSARPRTRTHIWHDPTADPSPDPALTTT
ncbi:MAG TPA: glucose-6-phosphate dehydrogenase assembly protein OpcA [Mycobacteriales bacterium]|nr:glucose-6-phosphate dehydrogenase assembly protein OpcA [Mycobacteriales bacterium]